jgi:hypothetical protein
MPPEYMIFASTEVPVQTQNATGAGGSAQGVSFMPLGSQPPIPFTQPLTFHSSQVAPRCIHRLLSR